MTRHVEVNAPMQRRERWGALACARGERPGPVPAAAAPAAALEEEEEEEEEEDTYLQPR